MIDITQQDWRMLHQTNRPSLQSPIKTLCVLVVHLLLTHSCKGQSQLIGSSQPIVATVGDDIILPCHLEPAMDVAAMTLEWTRSDLDPIFVHVWRAGQDLIDTIHPSYKGRTSLFRDGLMQGNISLKLSKVKLSDGGKYKCYIPKLNKQSFVELFVASGAASSPVISLAGLDRDRGGVVLQCESKGWYPQPEVFWLDSEGNLLSAGPTETVKGPDDLYTVSSRVTVEKRHNNIFTCRVQQKNINQIRETHIIVPDDFFKVQSSSSPVTTVLAVSLAVCILLIVAVFLFGWRWRQNIKTKRSDGKGKRTCEECAKLNKRTAQLGRDKASPTQSSISLCKWQIIKKQTLQDLTEDLKIKDQEIKDKQDEIQKLQNEKQNLQEDLNTKTSELEKIQAELLKEKQIREKAEEEVKKLNKQLESRQTEIQDLINSQQESVRKLKAQHEKELEEKQDELLKEKQIREKAEEEVKTLKNQLESKQTEIQTRLEFVGKLRAQHEKELEKKQDDLLKEKQIRESEVKTLKNQLESKQTEIQAHLEYKRKLIAQHEKEIKEKQAEIQKLQEENKKLQEELNTKTSEASS